MKKVTIIGNGQQGASMAQALAKQGGYEIATFDAHAGAREEFSKIVDDIDNITICDNIYNAVGEADIVILATPMDRFAGVLRDIDGSVKTGAIVTDVGSGKAKSIEVIREHLPEGAIYVPVHPIVGKAQSGPAGADVDMYQAQTIVVVPQSGQAEAQAQITVENMWGDMGGQIAHMDAMTHDRLYGTISHFEHIVALSLLTAGACDGMDDLKVSGDSMLDTTRIAGGMSADMWIPIFRDNKAAIMSSAQGFVKQLSELKEALDSDDPQAFKTLLEPAHAFRKKISEPRQREALAGEVNDIAKEHSIDGVDVFDATSITNNFNEAANIAMVKRSLMPTLIGAAITLNALDTEENHLTGVKIADVANPSFKDGSAPMLNDPAYIATLLRDNKDTLSQHLDVFERQFAAFMEAVQNESADAIRGCIEKASAIRKDMPAHRASEDMREDYVHQPVVYQEQQVS